MLKAGCMDNQEFSTTVQGTPQGGIISPVLANIALDGMETHLKKELRKKIYAGRDCTRINKASKICR